MALIKCPECGTMVSDQAETCPKCAYPINEKMQAKPETNTSKKVIVKSQEGCFLQSLNAGCMIIAVIIGIIVLVIIFTMMGD